MHHAKVETQQVLIDLMDELRLIVEREQMLLDAQQFPWPPEKAVDG